jgi:hypothetical protein
MFKSPAALTAAYAVSLAAATASALRLTATRTAEPERPSTTCSGARRA